MTATSQERTSSQLSATKYWIVFAVLLCAVVASLTLWWHRYTATPEYSLSQLANVVKAKNYSEAEKYVDEERARSPSR